jgi:hypothetical protein
VLALLYSTDGAGFVEIALVVSIEFAKGILEAKDITLLELGIFPGAREIPNWARWGSMVGCFSTSVA